MSPVVLRLGPLSATGASIFRSGIRWICEDGRRCQAGDTIAFCSIAFAVAPGAPRPFADESGKVQVALVTRRAGRLKHASDASRGGFFDRLELFQTWSADTVIGEIDPEPGQTPLAGEPLGLHSLGGRLHSSLGESRAGLLTGWLERARGARADGPGPVSTLLSLGICELAGVLRGDRLAFAEILSQIEGPAQVVHVTDDVLIHSAAVIAGQAQRTDADREAIARDMAATLPRGSLLPTPDDWIYAGALLSALNRSPIDEQYEILARDGVRPAAPAQAIILSLNAEGRMAFRHRRLGYVARMHGFRLRDAGAALRDWLRTNFEPVNKTVDAVRADYEALIDLIRARRPGTQILVCNIMSSSGGDDLQSYAGFAEPMSDTLASVRHKELNLMLIDLAREKDIAVVDADAIAAELGGQRSLPDGVHQNGEMQTEVRAEVLRVLRARGVPGFGPPELS